MDGLTATQKNLPVIPTRFFKEKTSNGNIAGECRDIIAVLSRKIDTLCNDCDEDTDRVTYIRSLTASLTTLNSLLKALENERLYHPRTGLFEDTQEFKYIAVRTCDLERFSAK
jgi:hypothetical protein